MKTKIPWIKNGKCINTGTYICNLGYACDGCPYNKDGNGKTKKIKCPECGEDLGEPISVDLNTEGWVCIPCNIKIYKEIKWLVFFDVLGGNPNGGNIPRKH